MERSLKFFRHVWLAKNPNFPLFRHRENDLVIKRLEGNRGLRGRVEQKIITRLEPVEIIGFFQEFNLR